MSKFDQAIQYVLQNEGGYIENPKDPGGRTNFGITQKLLDSINDSRQVETLTEDDAKLIYARVFWVPLKLDDVPLILATCILDAAVNQGPYFAVKAAQSACGFAGTDGVMGPKTIQSLKVVDDPIRWVELFIGYSQDHYVELCVANSGLLEFLKGWLSRSRRMILLLEPV